MMFARGYQGQQDFGCFNNYHMLFGAGFTVIVLILIAFIIYRLYKNSKGSSSQAALEILKIKLVNGEITEEEYNSKKKILGK